MPADDIDKRLREVENKVYSFESTFGRLADDIHDIRLNMQEFIEVKGKLDSIDVLFKKLDNLKDDFQRISISLAPLFTEHTKCSSLVPQLEIRVQKLETQAAANEQIKTATFTFMSGRAGTIIDWALKLGLGLLLWVAIQKGGFGK